jgi:DNA-binding NarL/FixJ family response regulator
MELFKRIFSKLRGGFKYLIFLVEDDVIYARAVEHYLSGNLSFEADTMYFPIGELAIENLHLMPDAIIMDYRLNSKYLDAADGLENIKKIKRKLPHVEIIILTGQINTKLVLEAGKIGVKNVILKNEEAFTTLVDILNKQILLKKSQKYTYQ